MAKDTEPCSPNPNTTDAYFRYDSQDHDEYDGSNDTNDTDNVNTEQWIPRSRFRKQQLKLRKQNLTIIFNYSNIELTEPMKKVLNRGLNFCILPIKLDITQVLVHFRQFERLMVWKEFWFGREEQEKTIPIFKLKKTNFPRNYQIPKNLKICLNSIKSEIMDPFNRNKAQSNISKVEFEALKELIQLQRECKKTIKLCDKGAGIMVTNFEDYLKTCMKHLNSKQNGIKPYYEEVNYSSEEYAIKEIKTVLEEAYDNDTITKQELVAMNPEGKNASKFYANFKVHKEHNHG